MLEKWVSSRGGMRVISSEADQGMTLGRTSKD
jgi:hypothetical protein